MKSILSATLAFVSYVSIFCCGIWAIVGFIIYLVKDKPFDWNSVYFTIASIVSAIVFFIASAYFSSTEEAKPKSIVRTKWQDRYASMMESEKKIKEMRGN